MLIQIVLLLCLSLTQADPFCRSPDIFEINLDLPVEKRYTDVSEQRKLQITNFIDYLKASEFKYRVAFSLLSLLPNMLLRSAVGE